MSGFSSSAFSESAFSSASFDISTSVSFDTVSNSRFPFVKVTRAELMAAADAHTPPRIIAAHYFPSFPINVQNLAPVAEYYYDDWITPTGEGGIWEAKGGYLRQTPPRTAIIPDATADAPDEYENTLIRHELRLLWDMGINCVAPDILGNSGQNYDRCVRVAGIIDNDYTDLYLLVMPDLTSSYIAGGTGDDDLATVVDTFTDYTQAYVGSNGRVVVSCYGAQDSDFPAADWVTLIGNMSSTHSKEIDIMPVYTGHASYAAGLITALSGGGYSARLYGIGEWARGYVSGAEDRVDDVALLANSATYGQSASMFYPVTAQVHRPKNPLYQGAQNFDTLLTFCQGMVSADPDHIQLCTWNDYSEGTEFAPSTGTSYALYDITAYYIQWWVMGVEPDIEEDNIYYCHRKMLTTASAISGATQTTPFSEDAGVFDDYIQMLAFLSAPATIEITYNGVTTTSDVSAGVQTLKAAIGAAGSAPSFRIIRSGSTVKQLTSDYSIADEYDVADFLYYCGSTNRIRPAWATDDSMFISTPWRFGNYATSGVDATLLASEERSPLARLSEAPAVKLDVLDQSVTTGLGWSFTGTQEGLSFTVDFCITSVNATYGARWVMELYGASRASPAKIFYIDVDAGQTTGTAGYTVVSNPDESVASIEINRWYRMRITATKMTTGGLITMKILDDTGSVIGQESRIPLRVAQTADVDKMTFRGSSNCRGTILIDNAAVVVSVPSQSGVYSLTPFLSDFYMRF